MNRRNIVFALLVLGTAPGIARAQQSPKKARVGVLLFGIREGDPNLTAFRDGLRQQGYVEGQNIALEYRFADSKSERLAGLAAELVNLRPDVIVVPGHTPAMQAARDATREIPIVVILSGDPVGSRLIASFARPGGNVTGLTVLSPELAGKRLELLKEAIPKLARVAVLWNPANPAKVTEWRETQVAAKALGLRLQSLEVRAPGEFDRAFSTAREDRADALVVFSDQLTHSERKRIVAFAAENRLPSLYTYKEFVEAGGLIAYGPSGSDLYRRGAVYVDKILKGAKPAELPVELPTKFELVINRRTARALGLPIQPALLMRADYVIE